MTLNHTMEMVLKNLDTLIRELITLNNIQYIMAETMKNVEYKVKATAFTMLQITFTQGNYLCLLFTIKCFIVSFKQNVYPTSKLYILPLQQIT